MGDLNCFVATAVYQTAFGPELTMLRSFRDRVLLPTEGGKALVQAYYGYGPKMAVWVEKHPETRAILRPIIDRLAKVLGVTTKDPTLRRAARLTLSVLGPALRDVAPEYSLEDYARLYIPWTDETVVFRALQGR
jgi:hypothetical protein